MQQGHQQFVLVNGKIFQLVPEIHGPGGFVHGPAGGEEIAGPVQAAVLRRHGLLPHHDGFFHQMPAGGGDLLEDLRQLFRVGIDGYFEAAEVGHDAVHIPGQVGQGVRTIQDHAHLVRADAQLVLGWGRRSVFQKAVDLIDDAGLDGWARIGDRAHDALRLNKGPVHPTSPVHFQP